ncbi:MAG: DUF4331 domain-containing protein, partial [Sphingobacteriales bacterium]
ALNGTALSEANFGGLLLPAANKPRSVDLYPIFHTGVPNLRPYQLATGKPAGNPLAAGKPFINNFLPNGGDMLRLNMAVPPTSRTDAKFSSLGLINAAVLGLTDPAYNTNMNLQLIPNMDGFPNGRRLEDDVTRIELQAVGGVVLAAIGLWYDDYTPGGSPVTPKLLSVLNYSTGIGANDVAFKTAFPYVQQPWAGTSPCAGTAPGTGLRSANNGNNNEFRGLDIPYSTVTSDSYLDLASPSLMMKASPNPTTDMSTIQYRVVAASKVQIMVYDVSGKQVAVLVQENKLPGLYTVKWNSKDVKSGSYFVAAAMNGKVQQNITIIKQ